MTYGCKGRALRADVTDNIPSLPRRAFTLTRCIYTFCIANFKSHLSYPRYTRYVSYVLPLNFSGDVYRRWDTSGVSYVDGQLECKVSDIQSRWYRIQEREFPFPGYSRLPYNAFIYLSSSSRLVHVPLYCRPLCACLWRAFRIRRESNGEQWHRWVWLPPSTSLETPPSMSPEFRLAASDSFVSSARRRFTSNLAKICRLRFLAHPSAPNWSNLIPPLR